MKDYSLNEQEREQFITDVYEDTNHTLTVVFADGRCFRNLAITKENLEKIKMVQEEQAKIGLKNMEVFRKKKNLSSIATVASGVLAATASISAANIPAIQDSLQSQHPIVTIAGVGVITILGMIPAYTKLVKNCSILKELHKIKYRNRHQDMLNRYRQYPNSLEGIDHSARFTLQHDEDPFSVINMDYYSQEDLRTIVSNIEREEVYQFHYAKPKKNR